MSEGLQLIQMIHDALEVITSFRVTVHSAVTLQVKNIIYPIYCIRRHLNAQFYN
jgi:hypothetical protein